MSRIFSSCPHDVANDPEKWAAFADYFQKKGAITSSFERFMTFDDFAQNFEKFSFVYAHPLHAVQLRKEYGFIPLAKYSNIYDEAAIIASKSIQSPNIEKIRDQKMACIHGTPSHAALLIDIARNHPGIDFEPVNRDTYPNVLMAVSIGDAQYGAILKSVWDTMISMKERVNHFYTTATSELVHVFLVSPELKSSAESIRETLVNMHADQEGKKILRRLKCDSMDSFSEADLDTLSRSLAACNF